jgi:hypothetical protein
VRYSENPSGGGQAIEHRGQFSKLRNQVISEPRAKPRNTVTSTNVGDKKSLKNMASVLPRNDERVFFQGLYQSEIFVFIKESRGDNLFNRVIGIEFRGAAGNSTSDVSDCLLLTGKESFAANRHPRFGKLGDSRD